MCSILRFIFDEHILNDNTQDNVTNVLSNPALEGNRLSVKWGLLKLQPINASQELDNRLHAADCELSFVTESRWLQRRE